jgi:uncharacterized protein
VALSFADAPGGVSTDIRIAPQSGAAVELATGDLLTVTNPCGEQVADVFAVNREDIAERLSSGRSLDYASSFRLSTGHILYSNRSRPMLAIVEDTVGIHDFLLTPCSAEMFRILYGVEGEHPSCLENLAQALGPYGVRADDIGTTFNTFMNVDVAVNGRLTILPPRSRAGDHVTFRAEMRLCVGVTACSAELSNNGSFKPIDIHVTSSP